MRTRIYVLALAFLMASSVMIAQKRQINIEKTSIEWLGKKIGTNHEGNIQLKSGHIELKDGNMLTGNFVIDMTSITNTDLKNENYNQKLVGHLKSDDFFGVENYPTAKFEITKSSEFSFGKATVTGDITIKGKTERISFDVVQEGPEYKATVAIDRSKFDVRYDSDSFFDNLGDKAIDDIFTLEIRLVLI